MSSPVVVRTKFHLADIQGLPDRRISQAIEARLTYDHVEHLRGADAIDPETGAYVPVRVTPARLYSYREGRLTFPAGFLESVLAVLDQTGCRYTVDDLNPPPVRPNAFVSDFPNMFSVIGELRPRQDECIAQILGRKRGLIDAPTAFGKGTVICAVCAALPNARIDVVVSRQDIAKTLYRRLLRVESGIGLVGAGSREYGRRITVYVSDSLKYAPHGEEDEADMVLVDEVHEAATATFIEELARYRRSRMFGFSASHGMRADGADHRLEGIFGKIVFRMSYEEAKNLNLVTPIQVEMHSCDRCDATLADRSDVERNRLGIWTNIHRNRLIAEQATKHIEDGKQVLILVQTVEHVVNLHALLPGFEMVYDKMAPADRSRYVKLGLMDGREPNMTKSRRDRLRAEFESGRLRGAIANDVWSTGVDFPGLDVLIRGDARSSKITDVQAPGRLARRHDGKVGGLLIDLFDRFDPGFLAKAKKRISSYKSFGWEVIVVENGRSYRNG